MRLVTCDILGKDNVDLPNTVILTLLLLTKISAPLTTNALEFTAAVAHKFK